MNRVTGTIKVLQRADSINRITLLCADTQISCVTLDLPEDFTEGLKVDIIFKETEVSLAKNINGALSISNQLFCIVEAVEEGRILSQISLFLGSTPISSIITTDSLKRLDIKAGDRVTALIKSNEVSLERIQE